MEHVANSYLENGENVRLEERDHEEDGDRSFGVLGLIDGGLVCG